MIRASLMSRMDMLFSEDYLAHRRQMIESGERHFPDMPPGGLEQQGWIVRGRRFQHRFLHGHKLCVRGR